MSRNLILATIVLVGGLWIAFRPNSLNPVVQSSGRNQSTPSTIESADEIPGAAEPSRTKSKNRIHYPKPTIEETTELLRSTIIPHVDFQDQTILEVAAAIDGFIQQAGIPPQKLRIVIHRSDHDEEEFRIKELRVRNIPLSILLKYVCDSTRLRYRIEPGIIWVTSQTSNSSSGFLETKEPNSPIEIPSAPDDPFAESPAQGADPFAEPDIPKSH